MLISSLTPHTKSSILQHTDALSFNISLSLSLSLSLYIYIYIVIENRVLRGLDCGHQWRSSSAPAMWRGSRSCSPWRSCTDLWLCWSTQLFTCTSSRPSGLTPLSIAFLREELCNTFEYCLRTLAAAKSVETFLPFSLPLPLRVSVFLCSFYLAVF